MQIRFEIFVKAQRLFGKTLAITLLLITLWLAPAHAQTRPAPSTEPVAMQPEQLGVVVNLADPLSVQIGAYYQLRRKIPDSNILRVRFEADRPSLSVAEFEPIKRQIDAQAPRKLQGLALTWMRPYRVECMSITTAFAAGFDPGFCASGCLPTRTDPYFDSSSTRPFDDFGLRPTMSIAARDLSHARALIDRGVQSDGTHPVGTAYLLQTGDRSRNVRVPSYAGAAVIAKGKIAVEQEFGEDIRNRSDILFYFIGTVNVAGLETDRFVPGAAADHLTSFGGVLDGTSQMSALRWLEAGATASYGAVVEPCNFPGKFPNPALVIRHYLAGETILESYWKSVLMPGQGLFIGEPLAHPFSP